MADNSDLVAALLGRYDPRRQFAMLKHGWDAFNEYRNRQPGIDQASQMADLYRYRSQAPMNDADLDLVNNLYRNTPLP